MVLFACSVVSALYHTNNRTDGLATMKENFLESRQDKTNFDKEYTRLLSALFSLGKVTKGLDQKMEPY